MIQELRAVAILVEDQGSVPSTHILAHNHLQLHFKWIQYFSGLIQHRHPSDVHIQTKAKHLQT